MHFMFLRNSKKKKKKLAQEKTLIWDHSNSTSAEVSASLWCVEKQ